MPLRRVQRIGRFQQRPSVVVGQAVFHPQLLFLRAQGVKLLQQGSAQTAADADHLADRAALHLVDGDERKLLRGPLIFSVLHAAPRVPLIQIHLYADSPCQGIIACSFVDEGDQFTGLRRKPGTDHIVLEHQRLRIHDLHMVVVAEDRLPPERPVHRKTAGWDLCPENKSASAAEGRVADLGVRMDPLIRDLPARRIKQRERRLAEPLQLHLHQIVKILSARVEQQQREALPCGVRLIRHVLYRQRPDAAGLRAGKSQLHHRLLPGGSDDRAAHGIVKLVEQHVFPGIRISGDRVVPVGHALCHHRDLLRHDQTVLRQPVPALHTGVRAVAAACVMQQIPCHNRKRLAARFHSLKIRIGMGK